MKKYLPFLLLTACQPTIFGIDEQLWHTLSENERSLVIEGYNKRAAVAQTNAQNQREKELENERRRMELDAQNAPLYAAADAISAICGKASATSIESLGKEGFRQTITIAGDKFEVSPFKEMSDAWVKRQRISLSKGNDTFYPVKIFNHDTNEFINARKADRR